MARRSKLSIASWRSWQVTAELMRRGRPYSWPIWTSPGEGYDSLCLVDSAGTQLLDINRLGRITKFTTWERWDDWATRAGTDLTGLVEEIGPLVYDQWLPADTPVMTNTQYTAAFLAEFVEDPSSAATAVWVDTPGYEGVNAALVEPYETWREIRANTERLPLPHPLSNPLAWLWAITIDGQPSRMLNLRTGELWRADGEIYGLVMPEGLQDV